MKTEINPTLTNQEMQIATSDFFYEYLRTSKENESIDFFIVNHTMSSYMQFLNFSTFWLHKFPFI